MKDVVKEIDWARKYAAYALDNLRNGATKIDDIVSDHPGLADRLGDLVSQLWVMEGLVREIEGELAGLHAEIRNGAARD